MHFTKKTVAEKRSNLISKLQSKKLLRFPGAYNPLCAKLIAEIGFDGVYVSGGVMSNDLGLPDIGLTSLDQVSYRSGQIARVTDLPTIVDIDTGFGNCKKTIEVFEAKGLAGCHLEDQVAEKRCGHLDNKELISLEEMVKKIEECVKSRKDKNFLIIARTDTCRELGLEEAISRINLAAEVGADMGLLFPRTNEEAVEAVHQSKIPLVYVQSRGNRDNRPLFSRNELEDMGYAMCIDAQVMLLASFDAQRRMLGELKETGDFSLLSQENNIQIRQEIEDIINLEEYYNIEKSTVEKE